jgi:hypothetical protein
MILLLVCLIAPAVFCLIVAITTTVLNFTDKKVKTPVGIPDPQLKPYVVVYEPPPPHVCCLPTKYARSFRLASIIECVECGQRYKRVESTMHYDGRWAKTEESAPELVVS